MRHPDSRVYLLDALRAADNILLFVRNSSLKDFREDVLLRSATERQFEIVGEALSQLAKVEPLFARRIPELPQVVKFRNILIPGYASIIPERVWRAARENLPSLRAVLDSLLQEGGPP